MARSAILQPYGQHKPMALGWRILLITALLLVAAFYGLLSAILPMSLIMFPATPIFLVAALCLWLLPDIGGVYETFYKRMLGPIVAIHILWPPYIALNLPGLPWISPMRVLVAILTVTFLFNLASSAEMRKLAKLTISHVPEINKFFWFFWFLTAMTVVMSGDIAFSFTKFLNNQIFWTMMFTLAAFVGRRVGVIPNVMTIMFLAVLPTAIMSIFEY